MSITAFENLVSTAERRAIINKENQTTVRFSDLLGMLPSITGKIELVYEGEQEGAAFVADHLICEATKTLFLNYFPKIEKLKKKEEQTPYDAILAWFYEVGSFELPAESSNEVYASTLMGVGPLKAFIEKYQPNIAAKDQPFIMEFVLWALVEFKQLSKSKTADGTSFNDLYNKLLSGL
jgi:magnesium chelatase subunit I